MVGRCVEREEVARSNQCSRVLAVWVSRGRWRGCGLAYSLPPGAAAAEFTRAAASVCPPCLLLARLLCQAAQQDSLLTSFLKVSAASFRPSTIVR